MNDAPPPRLASRPAPQPRRAESAPAEPSPNHRRAFAEALARHDGKPRGRNPFEDTSPGLAALAIPREFAAAMLAEARTIPGEVDPAFHAQLDRIAAAIAEFAAKGAEPEVHLQLPLGGYKVEGAVLGRDLAGQLNVLLIPSSAVPPALAAQWSEQLQERLVRRELRVGKVAVQAGARRAVAPA
ncbi:MAG: hypothetical protein J7500_11815 [Sphingomonas sp.]|uniref:hypothetical protein n=1 Tax=Sphingomonas sp. TaxID=28214 RepID=UPI001B2F5360|nr:hypothetical protein [Sphingomonas sp.]MBO9623386.1 hypothetical protein [Sphingomonas sp.]